MSYTKFIPIDTSQVTAEELAIVRSTMDPSSPEQWIELAELFYVSMRTSEVLKDLPDQALAVVSVLQVYQFACTFGGANMYVLSGTKVSTDATARAIVEEFTGFNIFELSRKYKISDVRVRQILTKAGALKPAKRPWSK